MKRFVMSMIAIAAFAGMLQAQDLTGTWQGTLKAGPQDLRIVMKISSDNGKLAAVFYSIDQQSPAIPANSITRDGASIKIGIPALGGTYEGKLDGNTINGTWTQGQPLPLNLAKATPETAWAIPEPPPPPKTMAADVNPEFEVSTIKPAAPGRGFSILVNRSGMLNTTSTSLADLLKFAYGLHPKQISGGPAWLESERFDITGKPAAEGIPNPEQLKKMMQKLVVDRFQLKFHVEKKEQNVYAITALKSGIKITKSENNSPLPGFGGPPQNFNVRNATMAEFATVLQAQILDRPVVDQTGLGSTRYDGILKFTPDGPGGPGGPGANPNAPAAAGNPDAPPDIFTAFQQQLGLKLESTKAPVDMFVIDRVDKPSEN